MSLAGATLEVVVMRAVPCAAHAPEAVPGCSDCLTGEQAYLRGVEQEIERLGVVSRMESNEGASNGG